MFGQSFGVFKLNLMSPCGTEDDSLQEETYKIPLGIK